MPEQTPDLDFARVVGDFVVVLDEFARTQRELLECLHEFRSQLRSPAGDRQALWLPRAGPVQPAMPSGHTLPPPPRRGLPPPPTGSPPHASSLPPPPAGSLPPPPTGSLPPPTTKQLPPPPARRIPPSPVPPPPPRPAPEPPPPATTAGAGPSGPAPAGPPQTPRTEQAPRSPSDLLDTAPSVPSPPQKSLPTSETSTPHGSAGTGVAEPPLKDPPSSPRGADVSWPEENRAESIVSAPAPRTAAEPVHRLRSHRPGIDPNLAGSPTFRTPQPASPAGLPGDVHPSPPELGAPSTKRDYDYFVELDKKLASLRTGTDGVASAGTGTDTSAPEGTTNGTSAGRHPAS